MKYFITEMVWVNFEGEQRFTKKPLFIFRSNTEYFLQF